MKFKSILLSLSFLAAMQFLSAQQPEVALSSTEGILHIPAVVKDRKAPQFYATSVASKVTVSEDTFSQSSGIEITSLQGKTKRFSLKLSHQVKGITVTSEKLKHWALRVDAKTNSQYLDIFPKDENVKKMNALLTYSLERIDEDEIFFDVLSFSPLEKESGGHSETINLINNTGVDVRAVSQKGFSPVENNDTDHPTEFVSHTGGEIKLRAQSAKIFLGHDYCHKLSAEARVSEDGKSVDLRVRGVYISACRRGGKVTLMTGAAALVNYPTTKGLKVMNRLVENQNSILLAVEKSGEYPFDLNFVVPVDEVSGWKKIAFKLFDSAIVPITFHGLEKAVKGNQLYFDDERNVVPRARTANRLVDEASGASHYAGFLPAEGGCDIRWSASNNDQKSKLFFTTSSITDVKVGGGMVKQRCYIQGKVLQGKLDKYTLKIEGEGDVTEVSGVQVSHWNVTESGELVIHLTGSYKEVGGVSVFTQQPLGVFPANMDPIKMTPINSERHSGYVRVSNIGAVSLDLVDLSGMMQITPEQFPNYREEESFDQVFAYRFPSGQRDWGIKVKQVLPELSVRHLLIYGVGLSDRSLSAEMNLDIREVPLRDWQIKIPDGYAVSNVLGHSVSDYVLSNQVERGMRALKIQFNQPLLGSHLIKLMLEKNEPAEAGVWQLPKIEYSGVKDVRGQIGVASALGWRVVTGSITQLSEIPLAYFQQKSSLVQQAYRQRKPEWDAQVKIEKLSQSVQADMFHLYTVREGRVECGVFINYFVVGAPTTTWRVQVPATAENLTVVGQNVRSHSRSGEFVTVQLEQPALGNVNLFVKYEEPMKNSGGELSLGQVVPLGVQSESGYVQIISPLQVNSEVLNLTGSVSALEEAELPAEYRVLSSVPTVAAWQYSARPFELGLKINWYAASSLVNQSVDFATIETSLTKEGRAKTSAVYFVKSRGKQNLRMSLPKGAEFWGVTANGERINVRMDGEQYLVPLPAQLDANSPVKLEVSYGSMNESGTTRLEAPILSAPTVLTNWKVSSEEGLHISPVSGNVSGVAPYRGETGMSWVAKRVQYLVVILGMLGLGTFLIKMKKKAIWKTVIGCLWIVLAAAGAFKLAGDARGSAGEFATFFEVTAPMVSQDTAVFIEVEQLSDMGASLSPMGIGCIVIGLVLIALSYFIKNLRKCRIAGLGLALILVGCLLQYGGAVLFFGVISVVAILVLISSFMGMLDGMKKATSATAAVLLLFFSFAENADAQIRTIDETWKIEGERLFGSAEIELEADQGERIIILKQPATLTQFDSESLKVTRDEVDGEARWYAIASSKGVHTVNIGFEMRIPKIAENVWPMVTAFSPVRKIAVHIDRAGWEAVSDAAVRETHSESEGISKSELILLPRRIKLNIRPKKVDPDMLPLNYFVETADLYLPAAGVLDGVHQVNVKPISGQLRMVKLSVPEGLMVGEVVGDRVDEWRFDPVSRSLRVQLVKPQENDFSFVVKTQRGLSALPVKLELEPLRVEGASKVIGMLGLGFGNETQPDGIKTTGMNMANIDDFITSLIQIGTAMRTEFNLQKAYRYGNDDAVLSIEVDSVSSELRMLGYHNLYLSEERTVLNSEIEVDISRAGVFQIQLEIPNNFEVESVTGASLKDFTELVEADKSLVSLQLKGRQIGKHNFKIALINNKPDFESEWDVPRIFLKDAVRQSGTLTILPQQGIQINPLSRKNVTQEDARNMRKQHPGALVFRLLQKDAELKVSVKKLEAWVTAEVLQELTLRDGQTRTRLGLLYQVEHAAIKTLKVRLPGVVADAEGTVRASGAHVKGIEKLEGDLWEVKLRRGMVGSFSVDVEYQINNERKSGFEKIHPVLLEEVKLQRHYVAVRANERLDLSPVNLSSDWRPIEWKAINSELHHVTSATVPELSYQLMDVSKELDIEVRIHAMADTLKLRVDSSLIETLFSSDGSALNRVTLDVNVVEKGVMRVKLPELAVLYGVKVNGNSVPVVSEASDLRFNVASVGDDSSMVVVELVYSNPKVNAATASKVSLQAPVFDMPIEKLKWRVILPKGVTLGKVGGDFEKAVSVNSFSAFDTQDYIGMIEQNREIEVQRAAGMMKDAHKFMRSGKQRDRANEILNQVFQNKAVGRDMNEDAHNLLVKSQWQHALMGLNTRRQKMYLENKADGNSAASNIALEEAAGRNPLFRGHYDYDPNQVQDFMQGMDEGERSALEEIAKLLVSPDIHNMSAPQAIDVTVPEMGSVLEFERKINLGETEPLSLELSLMESSHSHKGSIWLVIALIIGSSLLVCWRMQ